MFKFPPAGGTRMLLLVDKHCRLIMSRTIVLGLTGWLLGVFSSHAAASMAVVSREGDESGEKMLFDFTKLASVSDWTEMSDTVRTVGMSKATLVLQKTQVFQRAVFFSLLNPQPNGAGFAGVRALGDLDLSAHQALVLRARAQGQNLHYKVVLRHRGQEQEPFPTYENFFTAPTGDFSDVSLPLSDFVPYYRGRPLNASEADPLDRAHVSSVGLQVYGGVYSPTKQAGPGTLEVDWIKAV